MDPDDPELALDLLEERAALIEEGDQIGRFAAEHRAAEMHGYRTWTEAKMKLGRAIRRRRYRPDLTRTGREEPGS